MNESKEALVEKKHLLLAISALRQLQLSRAGVQNATDEVRQGGYWKAANAIEDAMKKVSNKRRALKFTEDK